MKFQLEIADRVRTVEVIPQGAGYQVLLDGQPRLVDAVRVGPDGWSLIVRAPDGGSPRSVEAVVRSQAGNGALDVYVGGVQIPVHLRNGFARRSGEPGAPPGGPAIAQRVNAPMPGKVIRVLVQPGAEVKARQGLVVVEAMKMENEVRAPRAGRIREVLAVEGQSVDAGTPLIVLE
jgi:biotin carboxyl carrier protein